jgi:hypothetical protein
MSGTRYSEQEPPESYWWFDPMIQESKKPRKADRRVECRKERMGRYQRKERAVVGKREEWKVRDSR